jgi:hypothetical protein
MLWARMVAYVTGTVNQELLLRNEYLGAENRILRGQIKGRLLLSEGEKATLAEIAQRLGRKALEELAAVAKPDTLLAWYRKLIANRFDGSKFRQRVGRPRIDEQAERLVVQMAKENPGWGYDRIVGALYSIGFVIATGCLHGVEISIGLVHRWNWGQKALRVAGAAIALCGIFLVWKVFARRALADTAARSLSPSLSYLCCGPFGLKRICHPSASARSTTAYFVYS